MKRARLPSLSLHQEYSEVFAGGIQEAKALETYIAGMIHSIQNHHSDMAAAQENALQTVAHQIHTETQAFTSQLAAAVIAFASLQNDLVGPLPIREDYR